MTPRQPRMFMLLTPSLHEQFVYECLEPDFGQAQFDSITRQKKCISVTTDPKGGYPCFTAAEEHLLEVQPA